MNTLNCKETIDTMMLPGIGNLCADMGRMEDIARAREFYQVWSELHVQSETVFELAAAKDDLPRIWLIEAKEVSDLMGNDVIAWYVTIGE